MAPICHVTFPCFLQVIVHLGNAVEVEDVLVHVAGDNVLEVNLDSGVQIGLYRSGVQIGISFTFSIIISIVLGRPDVVDRRNNDGLVELLGVKADRGTADVVSHVDVPLGSDVSCSNSAMPRQIEPRTTCF